MSHESIKTALSDAVNQTAANIPFYAVHPDKDFTRIRKISAADLISFLVSYGSSSTRLELLDFFGMVSNAPSASAFNQQRAKLKPDTLEAVFHQFNSSVLAMEKTGLSLHCRGWLHLHFFQQTFFFHAGIFCFRGTFHEGILKYAPECVV